jgi:hypothetical protein
MRRRRRARAPGGGLRLGQLWGVRVAALRVELIGLRRVEEEAWSTDVALLLEATLYNPPTARESFADAGGGEHGARSGAAGVAATEPAWIIGRFMLHWDVLRPDERRARPALRTAHKPGPPAPPF